MRGNDCSYSSWIFYEPVLKLPFVKSLIAPSKYAQLIDNMNTDNYKKLCITYISTIQIILAAFVFCCFRMRLKSCWYRKNGGKQPGIFCWAVVCYSVWLRQNRRPLFIWHLQNWFLCAMEGRGLAGQIKKLLALILVAVVIFVLCNAVSGGKLMSIGKNAITNESTANVQKAESTADKENAADTQGASDAQTKSSGTAGIFRLKGVNWPERKTS